MNIHSSFRKPKTLLLTALLATGLISSGAVNAYGTFTIYACYHFSSTIPSQAVPYFYGSPGTSKIQMLGKTFDQSIVTTYTNGAGDSCYRLDTQLKEKAWYADWGPYNLPDGGISVVTGIFVPPKACIGNQCFSCKITLNVPMKYNSTFPSGYRYFTSNVTMNITNYGGSVGCNY